MFELLSEFKSCVGVVDQGTQIRNEEEVMIYNVSRLT